MRAHGVLVQHALGEGGVVGGRAGLAVAEHGGDNDVVIFEAGACIVGGFVDPAAVAGRHEGFLGRGGVEGAVGDADGDGVGSGVEGEGGDGVDLDARGVVVEGGLDGGQGCGVGHCWYWGNDGDGWV